MASIFLHFFLIYQSSNLILELLPENPNLTATKSSNIKFQEMPEFRIQHSHLETSMTMKEEDKPSMELVSKYYTKLKIQESLVHTNDPFTQEYAGSAKSILNLLGMRDKYMFEHCQCKFFSLVISLILLKIPLLEI